MLIHVNKRGLDCLDIQKKTPKFYTSVPLCSETREQFSLCLSKISVNKRRIEVFEIERYVPIQFDFCASCDGTICDSLQFVTAARFVTT